MRLLSYIIFCVSVAILPHAFAEQIDDLHVGRIAIDDQSVSSQKAAGRQALAQVIVKMTGSTDSTEHEAIKRALVNHEQFLVSSRFSQTQQGLQYQASFDRDKLIELLRYANQAIWGARRPSSLFWIAITDEQGEQQLVTLNDAPIISATIQNIAAQRAIPVSLPIGDLQDRVNVNFVDVAGLFSRLVYDASVRYTVDKVVLVNLASQKPLDNGSAVWHATLNVVTFDSIDTLQFEAKNKTLLLQKVVESYANWLGQQYAIAAFEQVATEHRIQINQVDSLDDYAAIMRLLTGLSFIDNVRLVAQQGSITTLDLALAVSVDKFNQLIVLEPQLSIRVSAQGSEIAQFSWVN